MLRADSYEPDVWEAICTPMHEIIPAGAAHPGTGALFLGSWTAAVDADLLARHRVRAIVECLDAPWGMCESGMTSAGATSPPSHSTPVLGGASSVGGAIAAHTVSANAHAHQAPAFARAPTAPMPPGTGRPPISRAYTSAPIPTISHTHPSSSSQTSNTTNHNHGGGQTHNSGHVGRFKVAIADSAAPDILTPHLDGAVRFINERLSRGENVLVHCQQGISRSPAIVAAFLMRERGLSYDAALQVVRARRKCVRPNEGFERTLRKWK